MATGITEPSAGGAPPQIDPPPVSWWRRVGWLVFIWAASVAALAVAAGLFRLLMSAAGMSAT